MGTDIHGWVEIKYDNTWREVIRIDDIINRNYDMFGCLFGERHIIFDPIADYTAPSNVSNEVKYDTEFDHLDSEQFLTYTQIKNIDWNEEATELKPYVYSRDSLGYIYLLRDYELSNEECNKLKQEKCFEKDNLVYKFKHMKRKECLTPDWRRLFEFMRLLSKEFEDENVRLVVWFDR